MKIKQVFCKHDWETLDSYFFIDNNYGYKNGCFAEIVKCKKCGKEKTKMIKLPAETMKAIGD